MPPRRKQARGAASTAEKPRRSTRRSARNNNVGGTSIIPDVYQEMLAEAAVDDADDFGSSSRPVKRRKVDSSPPAETDDLFESPPPPLLSPAPVESQLITIPPNRQQPIVYDDFEGSDESDVEFEDVEIEPGAQSMSEDESADRKPIQLDLSKPALVTPKATVQRRKPITKEERSMRLNVHKWHLLSLIGHGLHRNSWCNDEDVHAILKPLIPRKVVKLLHVDESKPLYERIHAFDKGIEEVCAIWRQQWKTIVQGMRRAYWREDVDARTEIDEGEDLEFDEFKSAAQARQGSRDLGAQIFTALLRSIALDARLVFSLQVLPFTGAAKAETPSKSRSRTDYIKAPIQNYGVSASQSSPFTPPSRPKKIKKIVDSPFPIFWTEVLTLRQNWIPLDPIVRNTISKPKTQFEPPASDNLNSMTYVMAFEEDNSAHDVTRRYTQWFNAKTRKLRVESTKNGEQWYASAMAVVRRELGLARDEIEAEELARRNNSEGMPHNIQDFKNHQVYVLERHMRANEVLQPFREVGKVNVGTAKNGKIESVFRRQDVHLCRTADAWYRRGRDVRVGEQPLKRVMPKSRGAQGAAADFSDDEEEESEGVGLYAEYQTDVYEPPPVVNGKIPKNAYGNLDVYVPSMIPPGAVHISHHLAASAARLIGIDFADAVTGFEFKGRQGTAVVHGVVVAVQFTAAVASVIDGLERLGSEEVQQARSKIILNMWKKMLQALRVRERVEAEYGPTGTTKQTRNRRSGKMDEDGEDGSSYEDETTEDEDVGGGFMLEDEPTEEKVQEQTVNLQVLKSKIPAILPDEVISVPIKITVSPHKLPTSNHGEDRSAMAENNDDDDLFEDQEGDVNMTDSLVPEGQADTEAEAGGGFILDEDDAEQGGGFVVEDDDDKATGGGFVQDDDTASTEATKPKTKPSSNNPTVSRSTASTIRMKPRVSSTSQNNPPTTSTTGTDIDINIDIDPIHSDAEEDTALQLAIAQSLAVQAKVQAETQAPDTSPDLQPSNAEHDPVTKTQVSEPITTEPSDINNLGENKNKNKNKNLKPTNVTSDNADLNVDADAEPGIKPGTAIRTGTGTETGTETGTPNSSLLSHDPNEDDEEPEWLNEALD